MSDYNILTMYIAAAVSAAIFALYQIYYPAMAEIRRQSETNPVVKKRLGSFLNNPKTTAVVFFIASLIIFPIMIPALISESFRTEFVKSFVSGVCS